MQCNAYLVRTEILFKIGKFVSNTLNLFLFLRCNYRRKYAKQAAYLFV